LTPTTAWAGPTGQFVTASVEDSTGWWWGTDNDGLWHYATKAKPGFQWKHWRDVDGVADDSITALCIDHLGRLWAGTERHGVSVYNNSGWQNFNILNGPLGVHVTSIGVNPIDNNIWVLSDGGIAIYSDRGKAWEYRTETDGLSTNELTCVVFTSSGKAIVGTADDGLLISDAATSYRKWTRIAALPAAEASETGSGLPSNQINCLIVNKAGKIFCGTSSGLATSIDDGKAWTYLHGWMWQDKIEQSVKDTATLDYSTPVLPLSDDYINALAYDASGLLYIGHRQGGWEVLNDKTGLQLYHIHQVHYGTDVKTLTLLRSNAVLVGNYGDGAKAISWVGEQSLPEASPKSNSIPQPFPVPAKPFSGEQLTALKTTLDSAARTKASPAAYFLGEDWQTQGNWIGRYGRELAILCAEDGNNDLTLGDQTDFSVTPTIGLGLNGSSSVSRWLQWDHSNDPRVLYDPQSSTRRESEWDDQGDEDAMTIEGPDIWLTVKVPAGMHRLSLYFMNKDGHTKTTRFRDFLVQLKTPVQGIDFRQCYDNPEALPTVAKVRVENFWPGVYERFTLTGPAQYYIKISRNYSLNEIIQGIFIDSLSGETATAAAVPRAHKEPYLSKRVQTAVALWAKLDSLDGSNATQNQQRIDRIELLRVATTEKAPESLLRAWRIELGLWNSDDFARYNQQPAVHL
jgi:hypothetical protein